MLEVGSVYRSLRLNSVYKNIHEYNDWFKIEKNDVITVIEQLPVGAGNYENVHIFKVMFFEKIGFLFIDEHSLHYKPEWEKIC